MDMIYYFMFYPVHNDKFDKFTLNWVGYFDMSWIMMRHVSCILLLEWSTTSQRLWVCRISVPYAQIDPRFLFEKRRGQPWEFWSLVSTIDGGTLPQESGRTAMRNTK